MIVPGNKQNGNVVPMGPRPTETQLLMALAEMHRQGRFQPQGQQVAELSTIRRGLDKRNVQGLIDRATSDEDIIKIKREMEKRGLDTTNPQLDLPGE